MSFKLSSKILRYAVITFIAIGFTACKSTDETFNFAGETDSNEDQGAADITSFSPILATNIMCVSSAVRCGTTPFLTNGSSQSFSVSVTGAAPIAYVWKLNGTVISGADASLYTMIASPGSITAGTYTLSVTATNALGADTHSFTVKVNQPPTLSVPTPTNAETLGLNYASVKTLAVSGSDANSDAITYSWRLDGSAVARLSGSAIAGGSQGVYSPVIADLGERTIKVTLLDAHYAETGAGKYEAEEYEWTMNVNYLSDDCNDLVAGAICTVVGRPGIVTDTDAPVDGLYTATSEPVKVRPNYTFDDGSGNLFISDSASHVVWFHNRSGASVNRLGKTIAAGKIIAIIGNGSGGISTDNSATYSYNNYKLNGPQMMYYDSVADVLYVADYYNNRVVRINSSGQGQTVFGNLGTTNNATTNGSSAAEISATAATCYAPVGLVVNAAKTRMYVACSLTHLIKYVNMTDPTPSNWTSSVAVGRVSAAGAVTTTCCDTNLVAGGGWGAATARIQYPWALAMDLNDNLYYTLNNQGLLQVLKVSANPTNYFNGNISASAIGNIYTIAGGNGDTPSNLTNVIRAGFSMRDGRGLAILEPAPGTITGFFVTSSLRSIILFLNNSNATQTFGNNAISSPPANVTGTDASNIINHAGHTFATDDRVYFQTLTGGAGLSVNTTYYARAVVAGVSYQLATSAGGAVINFTSNITAASIRPPDAGLIWGVYSALGGSYTGEGSPAANSNRLNNPTGLAIIGSELFVSDTNNFRVRKLDLSAGNGAIATVTGGVSAKTGSSSDSVTPAPSFNGYFLEQMLYDAISNKIYFADNGAAPTNWNTAEIPRTPDIENHRIRRLDPILGTVDTLVGRGWGDTSPINEPANTALTQGIKGMALMPDGNILFADRHLFAAGASRSCMVRAYNSTASSKTYFSSTPGNVLAGNVATIAGNYANGCNTFTGGGGAATSSRIYYPEGIATDGTNLYIASYQQHCILKVDSTGIINSYIGLCGTANDINGTFGSARLQFPTQLMSDPRRPANFFVVDQTNQPASSIKYVNLSGADIDVVGSTITDQRIEALTGLTSGGYTQAMTAYPTPASVTGTASTDIINHAGHNFVTDDTVVFPSLTGGAGLGANTTYYVRTVIEGVSYQLSATLGGAAINFTSDISIATVMDADDSDDLICYTSGALGNGALGSHNVICRKRTSGDLSIRIGQADGSLVKGGSQMDSEEEGLVWNSGTKALSVKLSGPAGLAFDSEGNLYITERDSSVVRKIKKWW